MRPAPDDFATMAMELPLTGIMRHYQCAERTAKHWLHSLPSDVFCARAKVMTQRKSDNGKLQRRRKPSDFDTVAMRMQAKMLQEHYGCSSWVVQRWLYDLPIAMQRERAHQLKHLFPRRPQPKPLPAPTAEPKAAQTPRERLEEIMAQAAAERATKPASDRYAGLQGFDRQMAMARDNGVTVIPTLPARVEHSLTGSQMALFQ